MSAIENAIKLYAALDDAAAGDRKRTFGERETAAVCRRLGMDEEEGRAAVAELERDGAIIWVVCWGWRLDY